MIRQAIHWVCTTKAKAWQTGLQARATRSGEANLCWDGTRDQVWEGFGGCFNELGWRALGALRAADRNAIMDALFDRNDGCRFNLCRLPIGASDYAAEWYSHNEVPGDLAMKHFSIARDEQYLIPYIRLALKRRRDLKLFASPWSPPTWMKSPPVYNYGTIVWQPDVLQSYALYFAKFVEAYRRAGIAVHQVHMQNEPLADQKFPSCLWKGAQMREFIRDYLAPTFRRRRLPCELWLGTLNTDDFNGYPLAVLTDPVAQRHVAGISFQWAGKGAVQRAHACWPDLRLMQSENECGDGRNTWEYAAYIFGLMQHYIANGVNAYVYWNMVLEDGGVSTWGWKQNSMVTIDVPRRKARFTPEFYVMKHFARFVDPGAVRLGLTGDWAGNAVAFANPCGGRVVVVQNPLPEARKLLFVEDRIRFAAKLPADSINTFTVGG